MRMDVELVIGFVVAAGGLGGLATLVTVVPTVRKLLAEARKVSIEARVTSTTADDAHFERIIQLQTEAIVAPLNERVRAQDERMRHQDQRITALEGELLDVRVKYRAALRLIRTLFGWIATHGRDPATAPPVPDVIADDV